MTPANYGSVFAKSYASTFPLPVTAIDAAEPLKDLSKPSECILALHRLVGTD